MTTLAITNTSKEDPRIGGLSLKDAKLVTARDCLAVPASLLLAFVHSKTRNALTDLNGCSWNLVTTNGDDFIYERIE